MSNINNYLPLLNDEFVSKEIKKQAYKKSATHTFNDLKQEIAIRMLEKNVHINDKNHFISLCCKYAETMLRPNDAFWRLHLSGRTTSYDEFSEYEGFENDNNVLDERFFTPAEEEKPFSQQVKELLTNLRYPEKKVNMYLDYFEYGRDYTQDKYDIPRDYMLSVIDQITHVIKKHMI